MEMGWLGGRGSQGRAMRTQQTQRDSAEGNQPAILVFRDAYQFSHQGLAHKDESPMPPDLTIGTSPPNRCKRVVFHVSKAVGIRPRRQCIKAGWRNLAQGFMRAHRVIDRDEGIALFLLSLGGFSRRAHHFLLEGTVQSFVPPVLLRMSWLDALGHNAQLNPPHRERRQSTGAYRSEWRTIVSADSQWQTVLSEDALKHGLHMGIVWLGKDLAAQEHASTCVANSQGIASGTVSRANPTLEIGTPDVVGAVGTNKRLEPGAGTPAAFAPGHQSIQTQNPAASAHRWPLLGNLRPFLWTRAKLGRTPGRMRLLGPYHRQHYFIRRSPGTPMRSAGALVKPRDTFIGKASQPLVGRFPAHLEVPGQLCYRVPTSLVQAHHFQSFFHGTGLLPRQGITSLPVKLPVTYVFSKCVTSVPGLYPLQFSPPWD